MGLFNKSIYDQKISDEKSKRKKLEKRKGELDTIINNLNNSFSDDVEDVNAKIGATASNMEAAFGGNGHISSVALEIKSKKENYSDDSLASAKSILNKERTRVTTEIESCQKRINQLEKQRLQAELESKKATEV